MTQIIKTNGVIKNPEGRPIFTAAPAGIPSFIVDARRYSFQDYEIINDLSILGTIPQITREMKKSNNATSGATFSTDDLNYFNFGVGQSLRNFSGLFSGDLPVTVALLYKLNSYNKAERAYIYSMGGSSATRLSFYTLGDDVLMQAGAQSGTSFVRKSPNLNEWVAEIHYYDGLNSKIVDMNGDVINYSLSDAAMNPDNISLGGLTLTPSDSNLDIAYIAGYSGGMTNEELINILYELKGNFRKI